MFLIHIALKESGTDKNTADAMFEAHRKWFTNHFSHGHFLLFGPRTDKDHAGIILAQAESREALEKILREDVYYQPQLAEYQVQEFKPTLIAENIVNFIGK